MTGYFIEAFIYLCAAVIAVPLARRLGLGSVLGYLIAGIVIGPVTGLVGHETATIQHFAEFGVVMMLFLVGLELSPGTLWQMRHRLLGLGGLQLGITCTLIMGLGLLLGLSWRLALAIGLILSLSSTAIVLQTFKEKRLSHTDGGRSALSVLLFQDIAVIPMLALIPLLALPGLLPPGGSAASGDHSHGAPDLLATLPPGLSALVVLAAVSVVVLGGHYLSRPLFHYVSASKLPEAFTATALMLVVGIAALMSMVGLSPALGTFLAGVVLANSEFRHELESNIEPFKGLLLGLFFITVGAGINFTLLTQDPALIIGLTLGIITLKGLVLLGLALLFRIRASNGWLLTLSLAQAGEFGFVLISFSARNYVLPAEYLQILSLVVALSMILTPGLFILFEQLIQPRYQRRSRQREPDQIDERGQVIIVGVGRFGQVVNRLLTASGFSTTVLDHDAKQVDAMRKLSIKSYFGDACRPELLHTAGIEEAELLVIAIDEKEKAAMLIRQVKARYPQLPVLARAYNRSHAFELQHAGADITVRETCHSALRLGGEALKQLGINPVHVEQLKARFERMDRQSQQAMYQQWLSSSDGKHDSYPELYMQLEHALDEGMKQGMGQPQKRTQKPGLCRSPARKRGRLRKRRPPPDDDGDTD